MSTKNMAAEDAIVFDHMPVGKRAGIVRALGLGDFELVPNVGDIEILIEDAGHPRSRTPLEAIRITRLGDCAKRSPCIGL